MKRIREQLSRGLAEITLIFGWPGNVNITLPEVVGPNNQRVGDR